MHIIHVTCTKLQYPAISPGLGCIALQAMCAKSIVDETIFVIVGNAQQPISGNAYV